MPKEKKVARSAKTGEFVTAEEAEENPATTVVEVVEDDPDGFLDYLESLQVAIEDEVEVQADVIKASLNRILGGIASLHDARWQQASSAGPRVVEDA